MCIVVCCRSSREMNMSTHVLIAVVCVRVFVAKAGVCWPCAGEALVWCGCNAVVVHNMFYASTYV